MKITHTELQPLIEELKDSETNIVRVQAVKEKTQLVSEVGDTTVKLPHVIFKIVVTARNSQGIHEHISEVANVLDKDMRRINKAKKNMDKQEAEITEQLEEHGFETRKGIYKEG